MVLGLPVTVERIELNKDEQIVAVCRRVDRQSLPILDLPLPTPPPEGADWIEAYRRWLGGGHMAKRKLSPNLQDWIAARRRFRLSHAHVQMARELGMNPRKLGKLDNHDQEPWKAPLPQSSSTSTSRGSAGTAPRW
jgi:hypothetical protein